jgi:hypothetical protein
MWSGTIQRILTEPTRVDSRASPGGSIRRFDEADIEQVWDAIALHTTPGIPRHKKPVVLALKDPGCRRLNFCSLILGSAWNDGSAMQRCPDCATA